MFQTHSKVADLLMSFGHFDLRSLSRSKIMRQHALLWYIRWDEVVLWFKILSFLDKWILIIITYLHVNTCRNHCFQIKLEFRHVGFCGGRRAGEPRPLNFDWYKLESLIVHLWGLENKGRWPELFSIMVLCRLRKWSQGERVNCDVPLSFQSPLTCWFLHYKYSVAFALPPKLL